MFIVPLCSIFTLPLISLLSKYLVLHFFFFIIFALFARDRENGDSDFYSSFASDCAMNDSLPGLFARNFSRRTRGRSLRGVFSFTAPLSSFVPCKHLVASPVFRDARYTISIVQGRAIVLRIRRLSRELNTNAQVCGIMWHRKDVM